MSNPHNHPPRCCCPTYQVAPDDHDYEPRGGRIERDTCPACPEHGELAPRVDLVDTGTMFAAVPVACSRPGSNRGDGRGCTDPTCPRHGEPNEDR